MDKAQYNARTRCKVYYKYHNLVLARLISGAIKMKSYACENLNDVMPIGVEFSRPLGDIISTSNMLIMVKTIAHTRELKLHIQL